MSETRSPNAKSATIRYFCGHPGCSRSFARKEHRTRHAKSHDARFKHQCHICGSRYARSDVLRRHIQNHPAQDCTKPTSVACVQCREGKIKCDDATPCSSCAHSAITCSREMFPTPGENTDTASQVDEQVLDDVQEPNEQTQVQSPSTSFPALPKEINELHQLTSLREISVDMRKLVVIYFTDVQPVWPILHQASFEQLPCTRILLMAVGALGSYFEGSEHHHKLEPVLFTNVLTSMIQQNLRLQDLQAALLCIIYYLYFSTSKRMLEKASLFHAALVSLCRSRGIFNGTFQESGCPKEARSDWAYQEEQKRLALYLLRVDAYHSMITNHPPMMQYQEIDVALPKSESLWSAITSAERQRFEWEEPAAREKTVFRDLAFDVWVAPSDLTNLYRLSSDDYHLILCSMQSIFWSTALTPSTSRSSRPFEHFGRAPRLAICLRQLDHWNRNIEDQCHLSARYFSSTTEEAAPMSAPMSLYLLHLSGLKLHYPDAVSLVADGSPNSGSMAFGGQRMENSVSARSATWHAIQLTRIFAHETAIPQSSFYHPRSHLNTLHLPSICRAAVVVSNFLRYTKSCPLCTGQSFNSSIELMTADYDSEILSRWKENQDVHASINLGFTEVPFCHCSFDIITTWYQNHLGIDESASAAFQKFVQTLRSSMELHLSL